MEWSKLKNIILILLVATNLSLLVFLGVREVKQTQQLREARVQAMEFLASRDVKVDPDQIPEKMELLPQTVERSQEEEQTAAAALLAGEVQMEHRGGEVYRYSNRNGSIQFHGDGAFVAQFTAGFLPLGEDRERTCREALKRMGFDGELVDTQRDRLTFCQRWNGVPIFNQQVILRCSSEEVTAMTAGRRLNGKPVTVENWQPVTVASALFDFYNGLNELGDVCSRVDAIHQGYVNTTNLSGPSVLVPVWRIDTDTGRYQLDTMSGVLTRLP